MLQGVDREGIRFESGFFQGSCIAEGANFDRHIFMRWSFRCQVSACFVTYLFSVLFNPFFCFVIFSQNGFWI